ncbi:MAG: cell wall hydrolase [Myxococcales bacterium]|nr:cell wall hydrolase [Myxococcales bacterium]
MTECKDDTVVAEATTKCTPKDDKSPEKAEVPKCDVEPPTDTDTQWVAAMLFAEATAGRIEDDEREAIAWVILNRKAHNSKYAGEGMGTTDIKSILVAPDQFIGYKNSNWRLVMNADDTMKDKETLSKLLSQSKIGKTKDGKLTVCESFKHCVAVAKKAMAPGAEPSDPTYKTFIAYQKAKFAGSYRWEWAAKIGEHNFHKWRDGYENPKQIPKKKPKS